MFDISFQQEFENVTNLLDLLKEKNGNQTLQDEANERLKNITKEAEKLKKQVEDKLKKIEGRHLKSFGLNGYFSGNREGQN